MYLTFLCYMVLDRVLQSRQRLALKRLQESTNDPRFSFFSQKDTEAVLEGKLLKLDEIIVVDGFTKRFVEAYNVFKSGSVLAIDFETDGTDFLSSKIWGIGLSDGTKHMYIHLRYWDNEKQESRAIYPKSSITGFLNKLNYNHKLIAHNAKYEYKMAWYNYEVKLKFTHDTMVMGYVGLNRGLSGLSLKKLAQQYLNRYPLAWLQLVGDKYKQRSTESGIELVNEDALACYCCEDAYETIELVPYLQEILIEHDLEEIYELDLANVFITADMEINGILIDVAKIKQLTSELEVQLEIIADEVTNTIGYFPNLKSPQQLRELFYEQLKIPTEGVKKVKTGYSVDAKTRTELAGFHPVLKMINDYTLGKDLISKYLNPIPKMVDWDNRLHSTFECTQTLTGRFSSSDPNVQNVPNPSKYAAIGNKFMAYAGKAVRDCFIAPNGWYIVACDYAGFELRILAHFSNEPTLVDCFNSGEDMHSKVCCMLFGYSEIDRKNPQHESARTLTKTLNFGLCYGMSEFRLYSEAKMRGLNFTLEDCKRIIKDYWQALPKVREYFDTVKLKAIRDGYTETIYGRKRFFNFEHPYLRSLRGTNLDLTSYNMRALESKGVITPADASKLREAQNAPIQGSNADVTKTAMVLCNENVVNEDECRLLMTIHDELVFEIREDVISDYVPLIKHYMESAVTLCVPTIAEPKIALNWGGCK